MQNQTRTPIPLKTAEQVQIKREELVNERIRLKNNTIKVKLELLRRQIEISNTDNLQIQSQLEAELNNL
jgi:hypothetical protein